MFLVFFFFLLFLVKKRCAFYPSRDVLRLQTAYLYSMFKNQVEEYCDFSEMENCVDELTRYGLKRLREISENHLDEMDPYQRGASSISEFFFFNFFLVESEREQTGFLFTEKVVVFGLLIRRGWPSFIARVGFTNFEPTAKVKKCVKCNIIDDFFYNC